MRLHRPQPRTPTHPDMLAGEKLVGRTQGDALQLADLVREHGPAVLHRLMDEWGGEHLRRVAIALACAVDPLAAIGSFPLWEPVVMSTTVYEHQLWKDAA
jgi:hypothetical protein